jgi:outer membrane protein OmpA-like peptidoglycan-associated protein
MMKTNSFLLLALLAAGLSSCATTDVVSRDEPAAEPEKTALFYGEVVAPQPNGIVRYQEGQMAMVGPPHERFDLKKASPVFWMRLSDRGELQREQESERMVNDFLSPPSAASDHGSALNVVGGVVDVHFDTNETRILDPQALAPVIGSGGEAGARVNVIGHTDSSGSERYNKKLSLRRAESVKSALVKAGVNENAVSVSGMGDAAPVADNATKEGRAQNRRADVSVIQPGATHAGN